ncbi:MAG: polysaccharide biosynthesis tyrosine autokinase, partial [Actinomycetota bacterium]
MEAEMTLRDYWNVVVNRRIVIVVCVAVAAAVSVVASALTTPVYAASSEVLIQPRGQDGLFADGVANLNSRAVETEVQVIEGRSVSDRVAEDLGIDDPPDVSAVAIGDTDAVRLTVRSSNRQNAELLADAYATAYIDIRREQSVDELLAASSEVQRAIDELQAQLDELPSDDPRESALVSQQAGFRTTLDQLRVDAALRTGGATVIKAAEAPLGAVEPAALRSAVLAAFVGLLVGLGFALFLEYSDDKVRTDDDLERIGPLPLLAHVPVDPPSDSRPLALSDPSHSSVESYRGLRTNIQFLALDRSMKLVQVTSSLAGEGKTTTATNLAVVLARAGNRVAVVDADLRRPRINAVFGIAASPGLTDLLLGASPRDVRESIEVSDGVLDVYPAGDVPANPSELLSGERVRTLLRVMAEHYDFVIVDSAPILPVS